MTQRQRVAHISIAPRAMETEQSNKTNSRNKNVPLIQRHMGPLAEKNNAGRPMDFYPIVSCLQYTAAGIITHWDWWPKCKLRQLERHKLSNVTTIDSRRFRFKSLRATADHWQRNPEQASRTAYIYAWRHVNERAMSTSSSTDTCIRVEPSTNIS